MCCDCDYDDDIDYDYSPKVKKMTKSDFYVEGYGAFETEEDALAQAKKRVLKTQDDIKIYKAYKVAKPLTPSIEVTDYVVA